MKYETLRAYVKGWGNYGLRAGDYVRIDKEDKLKLYAEFEKEVWEELEEIAKNDGFETAQALANRYFTETREDVAHYSNEDNRKIWYFNVSSSWIASKILGWV